MHLRCINTAHLDLSFKNINFSWTRHNPHSLNHTKYHFPSPSKKTGENEETFAQINKIYSRKSQWDSKSHKHETQRHIVIVMGYNHMK